MARDRRSSESLRICAAAFVTASVVTFACLGGSRWPTSSFRCWPAGPEPRCPADQLCCSDDPAALDFANLDSSSLPTYEGREGTGVPLFSGARNDAGYSGVCVRTGAVPVAGSLMEPEAEGCPIPCNPNWSDEELAMVCGPATLCCQTAELEESDCVFDPELGSAGC